MNAAELMAKLVEIERALDGAGLTRVHTLALDAQESLLHLEQQLMEMQLENQFLLECIEKDSPGSGLGANFIPVSDDTTLGQPSECVRVVRIPRKTGSFWVN